MEFIFLTIFFVVLQAAEIQMIPVISRISNDQFVAFGGTAEFQCSVKYADSLPVYWLKRESEDHSVQLSTRKYVITQDRRFSVNESITDSTVTYTLKIKNVQKSDAGVYVCSLMMSSNYRPSKTVELYLGLDPPSIIANSTDLVVASLGETVRLECYARGFPAPTITWSRENDGRMPYESEQGQNVFIIKKIRSIHRGTYYCTADNGFGQGVRHSIKVKIHFSPVIVLLKFEFIQDMNYDLSLTCKVEAYPPPTITWKKNGFALMNFQDQTISTTLNAYHDLSISTLRIVAIEKHQYGYYTCHAENNMGEAISSVEVFEETPQSHERATRSMN